MDSQFIDSLKKLSGDELYKQALTFKENKDWTNYAMYLTMSANYDFDLAKRDIEDATLGKLRLLQDHKKTLAFYEATSEFSYSLYYLGHMYFHGRGLKKDGVKARDLYQAAAEKGNARAMHCLGSMYSKRNIKEIKQDYELSRKYYEMATEKGSYRSTYMLGLVYDQGRGVPADQMKAVELYKIAITRGSQQATEKLVQIYKNTNLKEQVTNTVNYFMGINKVNKLQKIYKFDSDVMDLLKENVEMRDKIDTITKGNKN